ncbi:hypothetical protein SteCoe_12227 [Stentor coeruleus]|uniref:Uncharacterized protein n=1 Tax=Stentor coeruleus TaxID=5963 RepID=A0A1R2CBD5_9CILI|nr:hypothetical protein SteCoe_12227 [Stentor coeruleus]
MRPTDLHFRSPREKTAEFLYPTLTSDGRRIPLIKKSSHKGSFSHSTRFPDYEFNARKTGYRVGPGAYELNQSSIGKAPIKGTPMYHKNHGGKDYTNNAYIYVGNSVIYDPGLVNKSQSACPQTECLVDPTQVTKNVSTSVSKSRRSIQETTDSFKRVPWYKKYFSPQGDDKPGDMSSSYFSNDSRKGNKFQHIARILKNSPKFE